MDIQWATVRVKPGRLPSRLSLLDPQNMSFVDLLTMYEHVHEQQIRHGDEFSFFESSDHLQANPETLVNTA
ncbi:hypothetical protein DACRYDRAFT_23255 [Dacryopinax primogenitus]|uniref:Uncharacterized protein n=1 Tax=Dacryopinax primogenitus (strain DJM 731) TaxID=1858805 RepID=M5G971_DACPD|nr:uncharacterized protein DACRYDRAFT_23255 [Dacryopinax primogenitus]EJU00338.1 hypothetical protein DACRYDRAFT_23255 [Dacryopinax primogenitus]